MSTENCFQVHFKSDIDDSDLLIDDRVVKKYFGNKYYIPKDKIDKRYLTDSNGKILKVNLIKKNCFSNIN